MAQRSFGKFKSIDAFLESYKAAREIERARAEIADVGSVAARAHRDAGRARSPELRLDRPAGGVDDRDTG